MQIFLQDHPVFNIISIRANFPCPCWRTASPYHDAATVKFQDVQSIFRVIANIIFLVNFSIFKYSYIMFFTW